MSAHVSCKKRFCTLFCRTADLSFASPPPSSSPPLTTPTPTPTPTPTTESSSSSNNNLGVIIGAAVGGVVGAALLGGVVAWLIVRKRGSKEPAQGGHKEGASAQRSGDIGSAASGAAVWAQQAATGSQSLKSPSAVSPTHPDAEVVVVTSPATTEQMLTTRKTQGVGLTGSTGVTTNTSQLSVGSRQAPVSASQPGSAFKAQSVSASGAFQDRPQSASGSGLRGYSSALGGPPSSVDSYSVYQVRAMTHQCRQVECIVAVAHWHKHAWLVAVRRMALITHGHDEQAMCAMSITYDILARACLALCY